MSITICILVDIDRDKACADQQEGKKKNKRKWKQRNHLICGDVSSSFADNMKAKTLWMKYNFEESFARGRESKGLCFWQMNRGERVQGCVCMRAI